jgi:hypothetical protein
MFIFPIRRKEVATPPSTETFFSLPSAQAGYKA